jgi:putative CocE/NonD family hydrolase
MCNVAIPMSDGAVMRANITRPGPGQYPTVVTVTGYGKGASQNCAASSDPLVAAGFNIVTIDDRGTGSSSGRWDVWGERTQLDFTEEGQWIISQPWSTADLGTQGGSYLGITSLLFAERNPDLVKAIWANVPMADAYRDVTFFGGNLDTTFMPFWFGVTQGTGATGTADLLTQDAPTGPAFLQNVYDHVTAAPAMFGAQLIATSLSGITNGVFQGYDADTYRLRSPAERASLIKAAIYYTGGWFDIFQRGEPYLYNSFTNARKVVWVQDSTYHAAGSSHGSTLGFPADTKVQWFDHYIKGVDNGIDTLPSINFWDINANQWEHPSAWPVPETQWTSYYLSSAASGSATSLNDGTLTTVKPAAGTRELLLFQPVGGLCDRSTAQWSAGLTAGTPCETDERAAELNTFTYTAPAQENPLHINGPITFNLFAELDRNDASFFAALTDVAPDGTSTEITSGGLEASLLELDNMRTWRNGNGDVILPYHPYTAASQHDIVPGEVNQYQIEIYPTNWTLLPGHRLRLVLGTANTPNYTVPQDRLQKMLGGTIRVLSGGDTAASRLLLPVIP